MNQRMGYILIIIGIVILLFGVIVVIKSSKGKNEIHETTNNQASKNNSNNEPDENKAKGDNFEKFIVKQFDKKYFTLNEWRSDKYTDGIYAVSNHFPDLEVEFNLNSKNVSDKLAIECKWRKNYYQGGVEWAKDYQLANYKKYAEKLNIPVFIVIGIGGEPENTEELFIIPLTKIDTNFILKENLLPYRKTAIEKGFYWDFEKKELK